MAAPSDVKPSTIPYAFTIAAVAVAYFAAARFGLSLAFATQQVTAVWPPTGIALVALLLLGYRVWPAILIGAFVANVVTNEPLATAAGIAVGNTMEGLVGAFLLRRVIGFDNSIDTVKNVLGLVCLAAILSTLVSATIGVATLCVSHIIPWSSYRSVWWVWWVGDAMGDLVVAPFLLAWAAQRAVRWRGRRLVEFTALFTALIVVSEVVFSGRFLATAAYFQLEYAAFPFLIWAALRFGPRDTVSVAIVVSSVAIWWTVHNKGPFAAGTLDERLILLDTFIAVTGMTALLLGAATAEREQSKERLHRAHDELEVRVRERTSELAEKNEEVQAFVYIVSHDLRAPLVNLQGFSQELEGSCKELEQRLKFAALPADVEHAVRTIITDDIPGSLRFIRASTTKFQRLIDALLALSRSGRQDYASEAVDVQAIVNTTIDSLRQSIAASGARVSSMHLPGAQGDATAIGQVFANLIGNALNYLQPGRPGVIEVGGEMRGDVSHYWVRDNGSGFPPSAQPRLFQVFQRFHPTLASGEGMGLAIVKRAVERHGGKVSVESQEGLGSTFHLTLPATGTKHG
ncbi:MAG: MASE1 domain-containing protein [bacterium]